MFGKFFGKKNSTSLNDKEIAVKIANMSITDMRSYINNKISSLPLSEAGLNAVMKKLTSVNETTSKRFIEIDDMDTKIKKAFDLLLLIGKNKKVSMRTIELIQKFVELYADIITKYDTEKKEIYNSRFNDLIKNLIIKIDGAVALKNKMDLLEN